MSLKRKTSCKWTLGGRRWSCWYHPSWKTCCLEILPPSGAILPAGSGSRAVQGSLAATLKSTRFMHWEMESLVHLDKFLKVGCWAVAVKRALLTYPWPAHLLYFFIFYVCFFICKTFNYIELSEIHSQKVLLKIWVVLSATRLFFFPQARVRLEVWVCVPRLYYCFGFFS